MGAAAGTTNAPLRGGRDGFTLLEVMIAVAVIAIAMVAVLGSQARSLGRAGETSFDYLAPLLAANKLAELRAGLVPTSAGEGDFAPDRADYRWRLQIGEAFPADREPLPGLSARVQRVEVLVTRSGTPSSYRLVSYEEKR